MSARLKIPSRLHDVDPQDAPPPNVQSISVPTVTVKSYSVPTAGTTKTTSTGSTSIRANR